ncbi:type II toxin-antitoxin system RelE/ParE family toxin [Rhodohalobacter sulfatireducens]|uniref:Type II toxin-antitoxin system RelE/ParE family toxin n=1 Tax=Rhodohalobacter sulfatireducens TaxID=2911366 RepID=A0ABS9K8T4_9BACT|nr:type II toxin-antitoxin system RelE/ParE family toxin [Rhodohalobacter sulfatireducens]MCG2587256.1 type II toxin-antitoxin system RelE/ParE family toxin [Rhodohalobacter sulfatireducens]MDR9367078.1 type II toxin-antitoxin system RelE/ParE family toxin [Balneolaceae bacterium]MDR9408376.1 type II toxin-antitoxin system RelE/ParE family toxin [Balneolaceae bacterium]
MNIVWSPTAQNKIKEILEYISEDNPSAALNLINDFERKVENLRENPESGRIINEITNPSIRELVVHENYGIIYEIGDDVIEILTVRHFRQNFSADKF